MGKALGSTARPIFTVFTGMDELNIVISLYGDARKVPVIITKNADSEMMRSIEAALPGGQSAIVVAVSGDGEMLPAAGGQIRLMRRKVTV